MSQVDNNQSVRENQKKGSGIRRGLGVIFTVLVLVCVAFAALLSFTLKWALSFWANLTMEEIVYHLTSPLEGTGDDIMMKFYMSALIPAIIVLIAVIVLFVVIRKWREQWFMRAVAITFVLTCIVTGLAFNYGWTTLKGDEYLKNQSITSSFIEDNYVDPKAVKLTFPKKKRNLIYIFLESVEVTFSDKENGGGFEFNCIPELTELAQQNEDFSGTSKKLNGGHVEPGTTFTMGGMFAQTCGLPLQVGLKAQIMDVRGSMNEMYTQEHFFPGITTIGDILDAEGYNNVLFIGSDAVFGGRKLYFREHGNYEIDDLYYAINRNWLEDKENSWGFCDWRLFPQAMERLNELAEEDEPFNLTMLTLDTHFEDGIRCQNCKEEFSGNTYADVFACSSRRVNDFISWCKEQDWYENTTIVLSGDHTTMDADFCESVEKDYPRRTYTCYINADADLEETIRERSYTTFDDFPTTLAAMGVEIEGDRLGLGTNLFSTEDTLYEAYGDEMDTELNRRSLFMEQVSEFDPNTKAYKDIVDKYNAAHGGKPADESETDDSSVPDDSSVADDSSALDDSSVTDDSSTLDDSSAADDSSALDDSSAADDSSMPDDSSAADDSSAPDESVDVNNHIRPDGTVLSIVEIMATRAAQQSEVEKPDEDNDSSEEEPGTASESGDESSSSDVPDVIPSVTAAAAEPTPEESVAEEDTLSKSSDSSEDEAEETDESSMEEFAGIGRTSTPKISDNPLEIGPAAIQMYPGIYRSPMYDLQSESLLRTDPYAPFTGNRQAKEEPAIITESADQLRSWIKKYLSETEQDN